MQKHDEKPEQNRPADPVLTGSRIRARRLDQGLTQAALAALVNISASYLNLIEHNRRRIGGKLLSDIARALNMDPGPLAEGAGPAFLLGLRAAALQSEAQQGRPLTGAEDFAGRFPDWAGLVLDQAARIDRLQARLADLTARMTHDPALATSLHDVISAVTAIRSAAAILVSGEGIDPDWQARFHRNINADARRLAATARGLVDHLERPVETGEARGAVEQANHWLEARSFHLAEVEAGEALDLPGGAVGQILAGWVALYRADARLLPLADFAMAANALNHDPAALARHFDVPLAPVLRRLASLPAPHPVMGLAVCDGAGALITVKSVPGFTLSRTLAACPLWPLFQSLTQPGRPLRADVVLSGGRDSPLRCYAVTEIIAPDFDTPPRARAVMLVQTGLPATLAPVEEVGPTCRLCPREACPARREPSILR